jgi:peptidyl-prolyl cis-trans isomerase SurA
VNEFSKPIYINNNYLIIKVNQKDVINEEFDENKIVKEIIQMEKDKQYQNFSQIYFNKIKLNTQINEF